MFLTLRASSKATDTCYVLRATCYLLPANYFPTGADFSTLLILEASAAQVNGPIWLTPDLGFL